jgi:DeoR/GlpR family transcriptional regulator of sugar metabolism
MDADAKRKEGEKMFIEERQQKIHQLLKEKGRVEVQELSAFFNVSDDSIRRDLRLMEQKGLLEKTYGGAVLPNKAGYYPPFSERRLTNKKDKAKIALLATSYIQDNDTIFLDGSSTVTELIPFLDKYKNITVFTNCVTIAYEIINSAINATLIMIGGTVHKSDANTLGIENLRAIEKLHVDKVFASPCAVSAEWGLSCTLLEEAQIKKAILEAGREVYLLIESNKFGKRSLVNYAPLKAEYTIITDSGIMPDKYDEFTDQIHQGLRIIYDKE